MSPTAKSPQMRPVFKIPSGELVMETAHGPYPSVQSAVSRSGCGWPALTPKKKRPRRGASVMTLRLGGDFGRHLVDLGCASARLLRGLDELLERLALGHRGEQRVGERGRHRRVTVAIAVLLARLRVRGPVLGGNDGAVVEVRANARAHLLPHLRLVDALRLRDAGHELLERDVSRAIGHGGSFRAITLTRVRDVEVVE